MEKINMDKLMRQKNIGLFFGILLSIGLGSCGLSTKQGVQHQSLEANDGQLQASKTKQQENIFPTPEVWKTKEGLSVWLVSNSSIPVVDMRLTFKAGAAQPSLFEGLASITNQLIGHGSESINEAQLSEQLDYLGVDLSLSSYRDMAVLSLRSLSGENFTRAVDIMTNTLAQPAFPKKGLQRVVKNRKASIEKSKTLASHLVSEGFWQNMYVNHPYAKAVSGTLDSLVQITPEHLRTFYQKYYVAPNGVLVIVGDIRREEAEKKANIISQSLPKAKRTLAKLPKVRELVAGKRHHIEVDTKQTHIRIGQLGASRRDADYTALYVANQVFGGGALTSVLGDEIREQRGWAYSVGSYIQPMLARGPWIIYMQTANETAEAAINQTLEVAKKFTLELTDQRIREAVEYLRGNFVLNVDSNKKLLSYYSLIAFYDLPTNYLHLIDTELANIHPDKVRKAWQQHFNTDKLLIVSAGKKVKQSRAESALTKQPSLRH